MSEGQAQNKGNSDLLNHQPDLSKAPPLAKKGAIVILLIIAAFCAIGFLSLLGNALPG